MLEQEAVNDDATMARLVKPTSNAIALRALIATLAESGALDAARFEANIRKIAPNFSDEPENRLEDHIIHQLNHTVSIAKDFTPPRG